MTKELKMVFESTNPEKLNQKAILKMADVDETLTGAQVLAEMQKVGQFYFCGRQQWRVAFWHTKEGQFCDDREASSILVR